MREGLIFLLSFKFSEFSKSDSYFLIPVSEHLKAAAFYYFFQGNVCFVNPLYDLAVALASTLVYSSFMRGWKDTKIYQCS